MVSVILLLLIVAGLACFCLSTKFCQFQLGSPHSASQRRGLKMAGALLLIASLILCLQQAVWGIWLTQWMGMLSVAAVGIVLLVSYQPTYIFRLMLSTVVLGVICSVVLLAA
jgi:hypothetical protein